MTNLTQGDDTYNGGNGDDIVNGLGGNDTINGNGGDDTINGGAGNDTIDGGSGDDQISGGSGDDTLTGGLGNDIIIGGSGVDTVVIHANGANGIGSANGGVLTVLTADGQDQLSGIEFIQFDNGKVAVINGNADAYLGADTNSISQQASATGNVSTNDFDIDNSMAITGFVNHSNVSGTLGSSLHGDFGTLTLNANGSYSYSADASTNTLGVGESAVDVYTYTVHSNGQDYTQTLTITINGTNDTPDITSSASSTSYTDTAGNDTFTNFTGTLTASDVDAHDTLTYGVSGGTANITQSGFDTAVSGAYGTLYINSATGAYEYIPNDAAIEALKSGASDSFTFTVTDNHGASDTQSFTVTLNGVNDTPDLGSISSMTYTDTSADDTFLTQSGLLVGTDRDHDSLTYHATSETSNVTQSGFDHAVAGTYGTLYFNASTGAYEYIPNDGAIEGLKTTASETFSFTASDGSLSSTAQTLTITLNGVNDTPDIVVGSASNTLTEAGGVFNADSGTAFASASTTLSDRDTGDTPHFDTSALATAGWTTSDSGLTYTKVGTYGSATITLATGVVTYSLNNNDSDTQHLQNGDTVHDIFTLPITDGSATNSATVDFTINGANDAAVITGSLSGSATEAGGVANGGAGSAATGTATDTDVDNAANTFQVVSAGSGTTTNGYGTFAIDAGGHWTFTVNDNNGSVQALNVGQSLTDTFTIHSEDGTAQTVTVTINGANDAAVVAGTLTGSATEAGGIDNGTSGSAASGTATDTDVDNAANTFQVVSSGGATTNGYGTFAIDASGHWTFTVNDNDSTVEGLNVGQSLTDTFTIHTADGTAQTVTITINGVNDAAHIAGTLSGSATEAGGVANGGSGSAATGTATDTDVDNAANTFQVVSGSGATTNGYGTFAIDASGHWTFTVNDGNATVDAMNVGQSLTDSFVIHSADGTAQTVTVTIYGANDAAIVSGTTTGSVVESGGALFSGTPTASGHLSDTDVDNTANLFQAVGTATLSDQGHGSYTIDASGNWSFTLNNNLASVQALNDGDHITETFTVHTFDGTDQVISIVIDGHNEVFSGTANNDVMNGSVYGDTMSGGDGNDVYRVNNIHDVVVELANQGEDTVQASVTYTLGDNVEDLNQSGHDNINATGNALDNLIVGNNGDNVLSGLDGDDVLRGGAGSDTLIGGAGDDNMDGGNGIDTVSYVNAASAVTVSLALSSFQDTGGDGFDKIKNVENITGSAFNDTLSGNGDRNVITGGGGADHLTGGASIDTFVYTSISDSSFGNADTITDLTNADKIDLTALGNDFAVVHALDGHAHEILVSYNAGTNITTISIDMNGDGVINGSDMQILATGDHHTFTNFLGLGQ